MEQVIMINQADNKKQKTEGTPKSITGAILNGMESFSPAEAESIRIHVKDFLAQHFSVAIMRNPEVDQMLMELFKKVTE